MTAQPPRIVRPDPAIIFLSRGQQLSRLQLRIIGTIQAEIESESKEFDSSVDEALRNPEEKMSAFVEGVKSRLAASNERWSDIQLMFQLFYCRFVDDFETFVEHTLRDIAQFEPSILSGVPLRKSANRLSEPERHERQLRRLPYLSIRELREAVAPTFALFPSDQTFGTLEKYFELRHLFTHNHGIVDDRFLRKYQDGRFKLGEVVRLDHEFVNSAVRVLNAACADIRSRAQAQFNVVWQAAPN